MPKQTFITKDFFVNASAETVRNKVLNLPEFIAHIKLVKENAIAHNIKFLYQNPSVEKDKFIDVSILELNEHQCLITLHCSYTEGLVFVKDIQILNAIENFEMALKANINNKIEEFVIKEIKRKPLQKLFNYFSSGSFFN